MIFNNNKKVNGISFVDLLKPKETTTTTTTTTTNKPKWTTLTTWTPRAKDVPKDETDPVEKHSYSHSHVGLGQGIAPPTPSNQLLLSPFLFKKPPQPNSQFFRRQINKVVSPSSPQMDNVTNAFLPASPFMDVVEEKEDDYVKIKLLRSPFLHTYDEDDKGKIKLQYNMFIYLYCILILQPVSCSIISCSKMLFCFMNFLSHLDFRFIHLLSKLQCIL